MGLLAALIGALHRYVAPMRDTTPRHRALTLWHAKLRVGEEFKSPPLVETSAKAGRWRSLPIDRARPVAAGPRRCDAGLPRASAHVR
jgi:hypothetical protein